MNKGSEASTRAENVAFAVSNSVLQVAEVVEDSAKWAWLQSRLQQFIDAGDVLVFASTQARVDELSGQLQSTGIKYALSFRIKARWCIAVHTSVRLCV